MDAGKTGTAAILEKSNLHTRHVGRGVVVWSNFRVDFPGIPVIRSLPRVCINSLSNSMTTAYPLPSNPTL